MSLLGDLRIDIGDPSGTLSVAPSGLDSLFLTLVSDIRTDIGDAISTQDTEYLYAGIPVLPGELMGHLRIDIGDVVSSGSVDECSYFQCVSISSGLSVGASAHINNNVTVGGDMYVSGNLHLAGAQCVGITYVTNTYNVQDNDSIVLVRNNSASPISITLPTATCQGRVIRVKDSIGNAGTYNILISVLSSGTIDGFNGFVISQNFQSLTLLFSGSEWHII